MSDWGLWCMLAGSEVAEETIVFGQGLAKKDNKPRMNFIFVGSALEALRVMLPPPVDESISGR